MIYQFDRGENFWRRRKLSPQYAPTKPAEKYIEGRAGLGVKNFLPCQIGISFFLRTNNLQVLPFLTNQLFGFGLISLFLELNIYSAVCITAAENRSWYKTFGFVGPLYNKFFRHLIIFQRAKNHPSDDFNLNFIVISIKRYPSNVISVLISNLDIFMQNSA